jgi:hypothetical protein
LPMAGCIVYAGIGFSVGVLHMLQASEIAAYCMPNEADLSNSKETKELDHLLAMHFHWWDVLVAGKKPWVKRMSKSNVIQLPMNQTELL